MDVLSNSFGSGKDLLLYCAQYVHIINFMRYEWDEKNAKENLRKHRVDFADAVISLEDENALTIEDYDHNE